MIRLKELIPVSLDRYYPVRIDDSVSELKPHVLSLFFCSSTLLKFRGYLPAAN
jgi:hypothetical protein